MSSKGQYHVLLAFVLLFTQLASTLHAVGHISGSAAQHAHSIGELTADNLHTESETEICLIYHLHGDIPAYKLSSIQLTFVTQYVRPTVSYKKISILSSKVNNKPIRGPPTLS